MSSASAKNKRQKRPVVATLVTLLAVVIMFALGMWQLQRAEQKTVRLQQIEKRQQATDMTLEQVLGWQQDKRDLPLAVEAIADEARYFLLDNKIHQGKVGYQVVIPVQTEAGILLVNLGWVAGSHYRDVLPDVTLPKGRNRFTGMVSIPEQNLMITETVSRIESWPVVIQQHDFELYQQWLGTSVLPFILLIDPEHSAAFAADWKPVVMAPEKHIAYAVQWFGLAVACLLIYFFALYTRKSNS